jgi:hypothetical protein
MLACSFAIHVEKQNEYNIPAGLVFSFPVTIEGGRPIIVSDIAMPDQFSKDMIQRTTEELVQERETVASLLRTTSK